MKNPFKLGSEGHNPDMEIFTIYDCKTQSYELPGYAVNRHDMIRQMINMFKDPKQSNNRFLINAEDFSIFSLGTFDKKTGRIQATNMEHVANLHELRTAANPGGGNSYDDPGYHVRGKDSATQLGIAPT